MVYILDKEEPNICTQSQKICRVLEGVRKSRENLNELQSIVGKRTNRGLRIAALNVVSYVSTFVKLRMW